VPSADVAAIDMTLTGSYAQKMDGAEEQLLLERIRSGDQSGFEVLVRQHADKVTGLAWRLLGHREEAEDLAQEAFLRLYRALPKFRGDSRISTWLYRTVTRLAIDQMRREKLKRRLFLTRHHEDDIDPIDLASDLRDNPARSLHDKQSMLRLRKALSLLSPRQRAIFTLRHYEGLPLREIAAMLDLQEGTVKSHLHRAISVLRGELADFYEDIP
jgi:RNA polymerase sigma-70 factor, ECF subfamily